MSIDWMSRFRRLTPQVRDFIDGRHCLGGGAPLIKYSPRDGTELYRFGRGEAAQADAAVATAQRAFADGRWSQRTLQQRQEALRKLAELLEAHAEELALLECLDVGKPIAESVGFDVPAAAAIVRYAAAGADKVFGQVYSADRANLSYQLRRPMGVVAGIVGWNFPLVLTVTKIAPALVVGNSVVLKPSELTSLSAARVAELAIQAGVPEGVFNVVHGDPQIGDALARHRHVDLLTFTGSTRTGKKLVIASGESNMKRLLLECGGKSPNIVFDDCPDLDAVAEHVVARSFWNQGQVCTASSRLLVQAGIKDELLDRIVTRTAALRLGDPLCPETRLGALVSGEHRRKVLGYIAGARGEGVRSRYESDSPTPDARGFYVPPVIFDQVSPQHEIAREEIFGPVLSVVPFRDEADAVRIANDTIYGLSAILWTKDVGRAHRVTQNITAGWIVVNATDKPCGGPPEGALPVGGHKESGWGVEGGIAGIEAYMSSTTVQVFV